MKAHSQLPVGWVQADAGKVLPLNYGKSLAREERKSEGPFPVFGSSGQIGTHASPLTKGSTLLIGRKGNVGAVHFCTMPCWPIDTVYFVEGTPSTNLHYFRYLLSAAALGQLDRSTTIPSLRRQDYEALRIPVAPLAEQGRVVAAIESYFTRLDDAEATLERVERNLERYRASVLQAAVEGRLVPTEAELARTSGRKYESASEFVRRVLAARRMPNENRNAEFATATQEGIPPLPEGWCWSYLLQLGDLARGKSKHRPRDDPRLLGGPYPFIQTGDVSGCQGFVLSHAATYSEFGLAQSRLWPEGTLCITIAANIAATGILTFPACFPDSVVGFLNLEEPSLVRYLELFLRTARAKLELYAPATAQKNINLQTLSELLIPLPPPAEQTRIISVVDQILSGEEHVRQVVVGSLVRCQRTRQAVLGWAFSGKLADQDPSDQPASVLLDRIRSERARAASSLDAPRRLGRPRKAVKK